MRDVEKIIKAMPGFKSTIQVNGRPAVVRGYKITSDAAYIVYNDGFTDQLIQKNNLVGCENGKVLGKSGGGITYEKLHQNDTSYS